MMRTVGVLLQILAAAILGPLAAQSQAPAQSSLQTKATAREEPKTPAEKPTEPARPRISLAEDVMPLINKLGCNNAACHAAARGQGNLRLSMFGDDPAADYDALVRAAKGRRINRSEPAQSLLVQKATGALNHGGQKRLEPGSPDFATLVAWISEGAVFADANRPKIVSLRITPDELVLDKGQTAPLRAMAVLSDGSQKDVTATAMFRSTDPQIVSIDAAGKAKAAGAGQAAIVANYLHRPGHCRGDGRLSQVPGEPQLSVCTCSVDAGGTAYTRPLRCSSVALGM